MPKKIEAIEGIGAKGGKALRECGCASTERLLEMGSTRSGRRKLAAQSGLAEKRLLKAVNQADLFRVRGIATQYAELLEASGVDTVKELRNRRPHILAAKMQTVNDRKKMVRQVPSTSKVEDWVKQAKSLKPVVKY